MDEARNAFLDVGGRNNLSIDIPRDMPWVMGDRLRMVQVLSNLLGNANRRSPADVEVSFADEGTGVPAVYSSRESGCACAFLQWPTTPKT